MFSSVQFNFITQEMLHLQYRGRFHAGPGPHASMNWSLLFCQKVSFTKCKVYITCLWQLSS